MEISNKYLKDFVLPTGEKAKNTYIVDYFKIWLDEPENGELIKDIKELFSDKWKRFLRDTKDSKFPEYASKIKATDKVATKNHAEYLFLQAFWSPHHDKNVEDLDSWDEDDSEQEIESTNTDEIIRALNELKKLLKKEYYIPPDGSIARKALITKLKKSYNVENSEEGYISRLKNDLEFMPSVLLDWAESSLDNLNKTELTEYQKKLVSNLYLFYYTVTLNKPKIPNEVSSEKTHSNENFNGSSSNDKSIDLLNMIIDALTIVGYKNINKDRTIRDIRKCKGDIDWTLINKYKLLQGKCKNVSDSELMVKVIYETSKALTKKIVVPYSNDGGVSDGLEHLFQ